MTKGKPRAVEASAIDPLSAKTYSTVEQFTRDFFGRPRLDSREPLIAGGPVALGPVAAAPFISRVTFIDLLPTDIPEDFPAGSPVTVPAGAAYLLTTTDDDLFGDNSDPLMNHFVRLYGCDALVLNAPTATLVCPTGAATFTCNHEPGAFAYRWLYQTSLTDPAAFIVEGDNSVDGVYAFTATGVYTSTLTITRTGSPWPSGFGFVSCRVSSSCRNATSTPQALRLCAADINCSGALSVQDIFDFLAAYFAGDPLADFNGSGGLSVQDIFDLLAAFFCGVLGSTWRPLPRSLFRWKGPDPCTSFSRSTAHARS